MKYARRRRAQLEQRQRGAPPGREHEVELALAQVAQRGQLELSVPVARRRLLDERDRQLVAVLARQQPRVLERDALAARGAEPVEDEADPEGHGRARRLAGRGVHRIGASMAAAIPHRAHRRPRAARSPARRSSDAVELVPSSQPLSDGHGAGGRARRGRRCARAAIAPAAGRLARRGRVSRASGCAPAIELIATDPRACRAPGATLPLPVADARFCLRRYRPPRRACAGSARRTLAGRSCSVGTPGRPRRRRRARSSPASTSGASWACRRHRWRRRRQPARTGARPGHATSSPPRSPPAACSSARRSRRRSGSSRESTTSRRAIPTTSSSPTENALRRPQAYRRIQLAGRRKAEWLRSSTVLARIAARPAARAGDRPT